MSLTPVAAAKASQVARGRCSPAETARRSVDSLPVLPWAIMALYAVGAVKQTVTRCSAMCSASSSGVARSTRRLAAPTRIGKTTRPPRPNVNAIGGVPVKTSSASGRST